uniref:EF-hand domain-containing protein n=1 Tax=Globodera rostochiensis TaxID=31243 RepID=A0A914HYB4_GLORO
MLVPKHPLLFICCITFIGKVLPLFNGGYCFIDVNFNFGACCGKNCNFVCGSCDYCFFWPVCNEHLVNRTLNAEAKSFEPNKLALGKRLNADLVDNSTLNAEAKSYALLDTDNDGNVSLEEFQQFWANVLSAQKVVELFSAQKDGLSIADVEKAATERRFFKLSKKEFDQMDTDQDGRLTFDEAKHGVMSEAKKVDADGDGKISKKEFSNKSVE